MTNVKKLMTLLYVLIFLTVVLIASILVPPVQEFVDERNLFIYFFFGIGGIVTVLGLTIVYLTRKWKIEGRLKNYLTLAGAAAAFFLIGGILHNVFYAIAEIFEDVTIINLLAAALEVITFLLAVLGSPILFIIGAIGSVLEYKKLEKK